MLHSGGFVTQNSTFMFISAPLTLKHHIWYLLCDYECPSSFANNDGHIYVIMYLQMSLFVICTSLQLSSYYFTHRLRHYDCRFLFNICQNIFVYLWFYHIAHLLVSPETVQEKVSQWKYFFTYRNIFTQSGGVEEQSV